MLGRTVIATLVVGAATAVAEPSCRFTGESLEPEPFAFEVFARQQGAPENNFYSHARDRHGRIILGMINGVGRFNGTSFRRLDDGDGSPHGTTVFSLASDPSDRVWVGTAKGLFVGGAAWRALTPRDGLPHAGINHIRYASAGASVSERDAVYVATQGGVAILDPT